MLAPPGPRNRSREPMSVGRRHMMGVPVGISFFFFALANPVSIDGIKSATSMSIATRTLFIRFIIKLRMRKVRLIAAGAHKVFLTVEGVRAGHSRGVTSVGLEFASFRIVGEISVNQDVAQETLRFGIGNGGDYFDAMFQVTPHPVGTADVDLFVAAVGKPEHTAVLEETADDAAHANVF